MGLRAVYCLLRDMLRFVSRFNFYTPSGAPRIKMPRRTLFAGVPLASLHPPAVPHGHVAAPPPQQLRKASASRTHRWRETEIGIPPEIPKTRSYSPFNIHYVRSAVRVRAAATGRERGVTGGEGVPASFTRDVGRSTGSGLFEMKRRWRQGWGWRPQQQRPRQ